MKYEYKTVIIPIQFTGILERKIDYFTVDKLNDELNDLGNQGWELVSVLRVSEGSLSKIPNAAIHYLKRKVED
ncbi:MAG: DUF4177 domain-containing protein [Chromatiales bacterium]|nr:DUF4177 domain-containing protein [Chromatiales bacterium]